MNYCNADFLLSLNNESTKKYFYLSYLKNKYGRNLFLHMDRRMKYIKKSSRKFSSRKKNIIDKTASLLCDIEENDNYDSFTDIVENSNLHNDMRSKFRQSNHKSNQDENNCSFVRSLTNRELTYYSIDDNLTDEYFQQLCISPLLISAKMNLEKKYSSLLFDIFNLNSNSYNIPNISKTSSILLAIDSYNYLSQDEKKNLEKNILSFIEKKDSYSKKNQHSIAKMIICKSKILKINLSYKHFDFKTLKPIKKKINYFSNIDDALSRNEIKNSIFMIYYFTKCAMMNNSVKEIKKIMKEYIILINDEKMMEDILLSSISYGNLNIVRLVLNNIFRIPEYFSIDESIFYEIPPLIIAKIATYFSLKNKDVKKIFNNFFNDVESFILRLIESDNLQYFEDLVYDISEEDLPFFIEYAASFNSKSSLEILSSSI